MESKFKSQFKKGICGEDSRRRREANVLALRKEKKEEGLAKRRNLTSEQQGEGNGALVVSNGAATTPSTTTASPRPTIDDLPRLAQGLHSPDIAVQLESVRGFRRLLSSEKNPPVQKCIDVGAVPMIVKFLERIDAPDLQFEAAWALTNIASTDRTSLVVECGAVPYLTQLLTHVNPDIREQCAWCLGNVAGDGPQLRDVVLAAGALNPLLLNISQPSSVSLLRNTTWALSNFCRGKPQPPIATLAPALPVLYNLVMSQQQDQETIIDAIWALSYISDGDNSRIQAVVDLGIIPYFVHLLQSNKGQLIVPALRTLGNIVSGNDSQTQAVIDANALAAITPLLSHPKKNIRKEACWMLSNIAAGTQDQLSQLMNTPQLLSHVLNQLSSSAEWDVRKEASWVISNIATGGNKSHMMQLIEHGTIRPLCDLLDVGEARLLLLAMEALNAILKSVSSGHELDDIINLIDEADGIEKLEALQQHENEEVYQKSMQMIEKYFSAEDGENESENIAPSVGQNNTFNFGFGMQTTGKAAFDFAPNNPFMIQQQQQGSVFNFGL